MLLLFWAGLFGNLLRFFVLLFEILLFEFVIRLLTSITRAVADGRAFAQFATVGRLAVAQT